jgi:hypothetical protein
LLDSWNFVNCTHLNLDIFLIFPIRFWTPISIQLHIRRFLLQFLNYNITTLFFNIKTWGDIPDEVCVFKNLNHQYSSRFLSFNLLVIVECHIGGT